MDHLPGTLNKFLTFLTKPQPTLHPTIIEILTTLPEPLQTILTNATYTYLRSTAHSQISTHLSTLRTTFITPYILTPLSHLLATTLDMPDLMSVLLLAGLLVVSLIILDYMRRFVVWWVMWWVRFIVRVVFWGSVVVVGVYVWNVGGEQAMKDAGRIWGFVMGFVQEGLEGLEGGGSNSKGRGSASAWW
jgi:hypothetical protein